MEWITASYARQRTESRFGEQHNYPHANTCILGLPPLIFMQLAIILGIVIAITAVVFALQNSVPVTVTFLVWRFDSSLAMVLLLALAIGAIVVALVTTPGVLRSQWALSRQRKEIASQAATIADLQATVANSQRTETHMPDTDRRGTTRDRDISA